MIYVGLPEGVFYEDGKADVPECYACPQETVSRVCCRSIYSRVRDTADFDEFPVYVDCRVVLIYNCELEMRAIFRGSINAYIFLFSYFTNVSSKVYPVYEVVKLK
jgi:hypothetical protein